MCERALAGGLDDQVSLIVSMVNCRTPWVDGIDAERLCEIRIVKERHEVALISNTGKYCPEILTMGSIWEGGWPIVGDSLVAFFGMFQSGLSIKHMAQADIM